MVTMSGDDREDADYGLGHLVVTGVTVGNEVTSHHSVAVQ